MNKLITAFFLLLAFSAACKKKTSSPQNTFNDSAYQITKTIVGDSLSVDVVIDKPKGTSFDVLMVFHGTVTYDSLILDAAYNTLDGFKRILDRKDMIIVSVAYPEENLLMGDNIKHSEAALLWVKNKAAAELGIQVKKVFLAGHSQGGYVVTRLNTLQPTNGVIANAPGPLNLVFRCQLEEDGKIAGSGVCNLLKTKFGSTNINPEAYQARSLLKYGVIANAPGPLNLVFRCQLEEDGKIAGSGVCNLLKTKFGSTTINPEAYQARSLLKFTTGFKSDILFVQGLDDSPIQMASWPLFKQKVTECTDCKTVKVHEVTGFGHPSIFENAGAKAEFNKFIAER